MMGTKVIAGVTIGASVIMMAQTSLAIAAYNTGTADEQNRELNRWSYGLAILVLVVSLVLLVSSGASLAPAKVRAYGMDFARRTRNALSSSSSASM